ncbi:MAG: 16S rRNA (cytosine(967)-C(5))-methyltransferase RsmB [Clostridia bacterium]|nr:16S rRNA (cytosine(967)-C(5))-methyltransferase RsmB [Clostridia bacterium]
MGKSARDVAVNALVEWEREHTYSNIVVDRLIKREDLTAADAAFVTRLVYGVIERCLTLDWLIDKNSRRPVKACQPTVRAILRVGAYQLAFMEKIPPSAAVNEAVGQAKRMKCGFAAGFVNGVLRAVADRASSLLSSLPTDLKGQSVRHSVPMELLTMWKKAYGLQTATALALCVNEAPPAMIRINTLKTDAATFRALLEENGVAFSLIDGLPAAVCVEDASALRASTIDESWYYFQDAASQWACQALGAQPHERLIDVCAAPGGKSFSCAMDMNGTGTIVSCDIYEEKTRILQKRAAFYGIDSVSAKQRDASERCSAIEEAAFDRVICDVPCSGYGVIRRKPEIRYKSPAEFAELPLLQYTILCESARLVKAGGVLQYSTCTLRKEENEEIVERFLAEHPEFSPRVLPLPPLFEAAGCAPSYRITLMPSVHQTDGFFIASFRKEETV